MVQHMARSGAGPMDKFLVRGERVVRELWDMGQVSHNVFIERPKTFLLTVSFHSVIFLVVGVCL